MPAPSIISFTSDKKFLRLNYSHSQFTDEEIEAQRSEVTCLRCTIGKWQSWEPRFHSKAAVFQSLRWGWEHARLEGWGSCQRLSCRRLLEPDQEISNEGHRGLLASKPMPARDLAGRTGFCSGWISPAVSESPAPLFWAQQTRRHSAVSVGYQQGRRDSTLHIELQYLQSVILSQHRTMGFSVLCCRLVLHAAVKTQSGQQVT